MVGSHRCNAGSRERVVRWVAIDVMLAIEVRWVTGESVRWVAILRERC